MQLSEIDYPPRLQAERALNEWCILSGYRGSQAHGMYIPNSDPDSFDDIDIMAICVPTVEYYYGLKEYGSRGTKEIMDDPWDVVIYEYRKFIRLLSNANPNVLSMLWLKEYHRLTKAGQLLVDNRMMFSTQKAYKSFVGYAYSQLKKMTAFKFEGYMGEKRKSLVRKYGYDCKNASHCIRLLRMGIEFLQTGELTVERPDAEELLAIKHGSMSLTDVQDMAEGLFVDMKSYGGKCSLPTNPDMDAITQLAIKIAETHRGESCNA